jgi:hypothetical protein
MRDNTGDRYHCRVLQTVLTALIAATAAFLFSILNEALRERRSFRHRWDGQVRELASDYLAATRRLMHLAGSTANLKADGNELVDALQDVRMRCSQLLLLADPTLAEAAVKMQSEVYAVVTTMTSTEESSPRAELSRIYAAMQAFVLKVRSQLDLPPIPGIQRSAYDNVDPKLAET